MLEEAVHIIRELLDGGYVNRAGEHFRVDSAKLWDRPEAGVPIAVAVSGEQSVERFAPLADHLVAVEPQASLVESWDRAHGGQSRKIGQLPVSWAPDKDTAVRVAHEQFRWFAGGWKVNAELPGPSGFAGATQFVRPEDVAEQIPCGDDVDALVDAARAFADAGFTDLALVQIGDDAQEEFLDAAPDILAALRQAFA
jgi:G6PDH family F420-dependent oxidoreductase